MRQVLKEIISKDIYSTPFITSEIKEKLAQILNENNFIDISRNAFTTFEDLIMMLNAQCALNEAQLSHN